VYFEHFDIASADDREAMRNLHAELEAMPQYLNSQTVVGTNTSIIASTSDYSSARGPPEGIDSWFVDFERWLAADAGELSASKNYEALLHQWRTSNVSRAKLFDGDLAFANSASAGSTTSELTSDLRSSRLSFLVTQPSGDSGWDIMIRVCVVCV
jgi:hypothetical protein